MKFGIYTIYDCKTQEFSAPFIQREGAVERTVKDLLKQSPVPAEDLTLWQVGNWYSETGCISASADVQLEPVFVDVDFLGSLPASYGDIEEVL